MTLFMLCNRCLEAAERAYSQGMGAYLVPNGCNCIFLPIVKESL